MSLLRPTLLALIASLACAAAAHGQEYELPGPPTARFVVEPPRQFVAKLVILNGRDSSDTEGGRLTYAWDLDGNGTYETSTGTDSAVGTAFCTPGINPVGLRVTDPTGLSDTARGSVDIVQASPANSCDLTSPTARLSRISRSLRRALRRSLAVRLRCSEACVIGATLGVDRRTGRRYGLRGRRRTLARASAAVTQAGSRRLSLRFSRTARRKLRLARRVRVTLRFTLRDAPGNVRRIRRTITLRR